MLKKYIQCIFIVLLYNITYDTVLITNGKKYGLFDFSITTDHAGIKKKWKMKRFVVDLFTEATAFVASMEATPLDFW